MVIYIVVLQREYSNPKILAAYSDLEKAKRLVNIFKCRDEHDIDLFRSLVKRKDELTDKELELLDYLIFKDFIDDIYIKKEKLR